MSNPLLSITRVIRRRLGRIITGALAIITATTATATSVPVSMSATLSNTPAGTRLVLSWPSQPGARYGLQYRASFSPSFPWQDFDLFRPTGTTFKVTLDGDPLKEEAHFREATGFYQLVLPEPAIFRIEPAVSSTAGGTTLYLTGQCLATNGSVRIGGLVIPPNVLQAGSLYSFTAPALAEGVYDVEWMEGGQVVATRARAFTVGNDVHFSQRLLEPPAEPPAAPRFREVTGLDVYIDCLEIQEGGVNTGAHKRPGASRRAASGEIQFTEVDLQIPGRGLDFTFQRTYRSRTAPAGSTMGLGWTHSYEIRVGNWNAATGHFDLWDGSGRVDRFFRGTNGLYSRDELFCEGSVSNNTFTLTFPDSGKWIFHPFNGGAEAGKIARIEDRNGNALLLHYDVQGRCAQIVDTLDRTNTLAYTPDGFVSAVTDFTGRPVRYGYARTIGGVTPPGVLTSVTNPPVIGTPNGNDFPNGKVHRYNYTSGFADERLNRNLISCIDGRGQTTWQFTYRTNQDPASIAFDTVGLVQRGPYRMKLFRLPQTPSPQNRYAVIRCIENDGAGNVTEFFYDSLNRLVTQREFTGRANPALPTTDTLNRPANKLRQDDPDYFENNWEWNLDSLCVRHLRPHPNVVQLTGKTTHFLYERDFNKIASPRKKGDLRVLRETACCGGADTDDDGIANFTERTVRFQHDSRFGSDLRPWIDSLISSKSALVHQELHRPSMALGFATSVTDARGGNAICTYDPRGNLLEVRHAAPIGAENYEYNAFGQRTAHVDFADGEGRRRRDENIYYTSGPQNGYLRHHIQDCIATGFHLTNTFEYDARGNLVRLIDPRGFDSLWTFNALDQPTTRQTPQSSFGTLVRTTTFFTYDANDQLVQTDVENRDHTGALDATNALWTTEYTIDAETGQLAVECIEIAHEGLKACTAYGYDANGNLVLKRSPEAVNGHDLNAVVAYSYDERDLLFEVAAAPGTGQGAIDRYDYDATGSRKKVSKIDSFTIKQTTYVHDGFGREVQVVDALGNVAISGFDQNDNLVFERHLGETNDVAGNVGNRRLAETRYEYDGMDRVTRFRPAFFDIFTELSIGDGEATTTFAYAPNGQLLSETDDNGRPTRYAYDSAGRLASVTDAKTNVVLHAYDASGNPTNVTSIERSDLGGAEQRFSVSSAYDGRGRLISRADNVGNTEQYAHDSRGNDVRFIHSRGGLTGWTYDGLSRPTLAIADLNGDGLLDYETDLGSESAYDHNSRLISTTDDNGNVTRYAYDSLDRPVATTNADNTVVRLVWSPRSNLTLRQDANGTVVSNSYDLLDRCVRRDIAPGPGVADTTTLETFEYDGASRLVRAATQGTSPGGVEHTFIWNSLSDLGAQSSGGLTLRATHDGVGNRLSATYPSGRVVQHTYDSLNQPATVSTVGAVGLTQLAAYGYDGPGRLSRIARLNGINTRLNWDGLENPANPAGDFGWRQVSRVNHARSGGNPVIDQRIAAYDRTQNKTLRAQTAPFSTGGALQTNAFAYDLTHRLTRGTKSRGPVIEQDTQYQLDGNGNRQFVIENSLVLDYTMNPATPVPADYQMNQYSQSPFGTHQYDANGNLVSTDAGAGPTEYHYDYANRLVLVERTVGPATITIVAYVYDALGRRVSKTTFPPSPAAPETTSYFHDADSDGDGIIEERENGALARTYVLPEVGDEVLVMFDAAGQPLYFHSDDLGNVLALTDAGGGIVERYDYADYGLPQFLDAKGDPLLAGGVPVTSSPAGNPFLFLSMEWDAETRLYRDKGLTGVNPLYEGNRLYVGGLSWSSGGAPYDPNLGRTLTRAPGDVLIDMKDQSLKKGFINPWSGGGGGGGAGGMRAGISTSRSNLRRSSKFASGGGGGSGGSMRAGISTSRSNIRNRASFTDGGGGGGGASTRAGISTSRSNIRTRGGFVGGGGGAGDDAIEVMFNPKEYTISKSTPWQHRDFEKNTENVSGGFGLLGISEPLVHTYRWRASMREMTTGADWDYRLYGPGAAHWGSAKFTSACTLGGSKELQAWWQEAAKGKNIRKNISVTLRGHRDVGGYRASSFRANGNGNGNPSEIKVKFTTK